MHTSVRSPSPSPRTHTLVNTNKQITQPDPPSLSFSCFVVSSFRFFLLSLSSAPFPSSYFFLLLSFIYFFFLLHFLSPFFPSSPPSHPPPLPQPLPPSLLPFPLPLFPFLSPCPSLSPTLIQKLKKTNTHKLDPKSCPNS